MPSAYTVRQAAGRMGMTAANVRQWISAGKLVVVPDTDPLEVRAEEVDAARAEALAKFTDVRDTTAVAVVPDLPVEVVSEWLRAVSASQDLLDKGVEQVRRSNRLLADALASLLSMDR